MTAARTTRKVSTVSLSSTAALPGRASLYENIELAVAVLIAVYGYAYQLTWAFDYFSNFAKTYPARGGKFHPGWFFGFPVDDADAQWRGWRAKFPLLLAGMALFVALSFAFKKIASRGRADLKPSDLGQSVSPPADADVAQPMVMSLITPDQQRYGERMLSFYATVGVLFVLAIHHYYGLMFLSVTAATFLLGKFLAASRALPVATWILNLGLLFLLYYCDGFKFAWLHSGLAFMDRSKGLIGYDTFFRFLMLRHISFNMDFYWALREKPLSRNIMDPSVPEEKRRKEQHLPLPAYSLCNLLAYVYYPPLYFAGPLLSYNSFCSQVVRPFTSHTWRQLVWLMAKVLLYFLLFDIYLHFFYWNLFNQVGFWKTRLPGFAVPMCAYWVLNYMFMKFLIIWRFFRTVALFDGIESPENMTNCINNNYTFAGFWRSWHSSFNLWIIRYLYIPLGGRNTQLITIWIIFFFVGLWHDFWWEWIAWAMLNCVFFSLELCVKLYFGSPKWAWLRNSPYYKYVVIVAGLLNSHLIMAANLAILHGFSNTFVFLRLACMQPDSFSGWWRGCVWYMSGLVIILRLDAWRRKEKGG